MLLFCLMLVSSPASADRPNIIIIFTDDQGYNDLGCFGSPNIRTPNIDRMAAEGMKLTSFYSGASVCTPSRAALLTGCYPERVGNLNVLFPNSDVGLNPEETTIAEMLKSNGYTTACFGKWHLGHHQPFLPTEHGFDEYFGIPYSNDMGVDGSMPLSDNIILHEGRTVEDFRAEAAKEPPLMRGNQVIEWPADQTQLTSRYTEEAVRFITKNADKPFFLYLPHTMPHIPLYASDRFRGTSEAGLYGDTLEEIDWSVGEILQTLKKLNIDDRTMVVYTTDNGPWDLKGNNTDKVKGNMNRRIGGSAYPLKGFKFSKWEGGMRVPCVMRWPGRIPAGKTCDEIAASIDLLPTIAELSGTTVSAERSIDGKSIVPLIEGKAGVKTPHETYFYRTAGVRSGKWKYIAQKDQLFDLAQDISESTNVAEQHPEVLSRLKQLLDNHKADMKANGRPPGHFQRPPHPLKVLPGWTVQTGNWNLNRKVTLRQNSNWTNSEAVSPKISGQVAVIEVEARRIDADGGFGVALLLANGKDRISLSLGDSQNTQHTLNASTGEHAATSGSLDGTQWHHIRLSISGMKVTALVNEKRIAELTLHAPAAVEQIALTGLMSKSEYRNLTVTANDGSNLLNILTDGK